MTGYPTVCCICHQRIVKAHNQPLQFHHNHVTGQSLSWHTRCGTPLLVAVKR